MYFPWYHSLTQCKIWLRPINKHLFLWAGEGGGCAASTASGPAGKVPLSLLVPLSRALARCLQGMNYFLNARMVLSLLAKRKMSHGEMKGKERPLAPGRVLGWVLPAVPMLQQWFPMQTSLSRLSPSTELISC